MLVAKFPGSMYATQATNAGPRNGRIREIPHLELRPSSTAAAAESAGLWRPFGARAPKSRSVIGEIPDTLRPVFHRRAGPWDARSGGDPRVTAPEPARLVPLSC